MRVATGLSENRQAWTFLAYATGPDRDVVTDWINECGMSAKAALDTRLRILRAQPPTGWGRPLFDTLHGNCKGLSEIIFNVKRVQWRPLGFFLGGWKEKKFVVVFIASKESDRGRHHFKPRKACEAALERKEEILSAQIPGVRIYEPE